MHIDNYLQGERYGRLLVIVEVEKLIRVSGRSVRQYKCECNCGNIVIRTIDSLNLKRTKIQSCGCYMKEFMKTEWGFKTHRLTSCPIYTIWSSMKKRCNNPKDCNYKYYGAKGISVCDEWQTFVNFYNDMWSGYKEGLTLDRFPNKKGNYEPSNCRWATYKQQNRNTTFNRMVTYNGVTKCVAEWAEITGVKHWKIMNRLKYKWDEEDAILGKSQQERNRNLFKLKNIA